MIKFIKMRESKTNRQYSKIDKNTILKGSIKAQTDIRIDGILEGDIETSGKLIIAKEAKVKGKILCENADIEGVFRGELTASGILSLKTGCNIKGKIRIQKLIVESGAIFNASCSMHSKEDGDRKIKDGFKKIKIEQNTAISESSETIGAWAESIKVDDDPGVVNLNSAKNQKRSTVKRN